MNAVTASAQHRAFAPLAGPASLTDQVVESVRRAILHGDLAPGRLYSAYQLADELGISRSPVREALLRLAETGMVRLERNRGFRVVVPEAREIAEIFHLRLLLEVPAVGRVAATASPALVEALRDELAEMRTAAAVHDETLFMRHDQRLHDLILTASGNTRLAAHIGGLRDLTRLLGASTVDRSRTLEDIGAEHEPIVAAIAAGDPDAARTAMAAHITHTGRLLVAQAVAGDADPEALWASVVG